jgi:hypothetical protein
MSPPRISAAVAGSRTTPFFPGTTTFGAFPTNGFDDELPDRRCAIRSAICCGVNAASKPSGMSDSGVARIRCTLLRATVSTVPPPLISFNSAGVSD